MVFFDGSRLQRFCGTVPLESIGITRTDWTRNEELDRESRKAGNKSFRMDLEKEIAMSSRRASRFLAEPDKLSRRTPGDCHGQRRNSQGSLRGIHLIKDKVGKFFRQILIRRKNKVSPAPSTSTTCVKACDNGTNKRPRPTKAENSHKSREENGVAENESIRADNETGLENFVNEYVTDELKKISSMFLVTSVGEDENVRTTDMKVNVEEQTAPTP